MKTLNNYKLAKSNILFFLLFSFTISATSQRVNNKEKSILKGNVIISWNKTDNHFKIKTIKNIELRLYKNNKLIDKKMTFGTRLIEIPFKNFGYKITEKINKTNPSVELHIYTKEYLKKLKHNKIIVDNLNSVDLEYYQDYELYKENDIPDHEDRIQNNRDN